MPGILVGLDGSNYSERALEWAAKEAALRNAPLRVLAVHAVPVGFSGHAAPYPEDNPLIASTKVSAQELTDKVLAGIGSGRPDGVTVDAVGGIPADVLLQASEDADMIVLGARGGGGFARLRLGSVSDQVAHHAHCPVVIIPHRDR
ncbi:MAG TPA: universal stress protein [Trebonia sp.]|jgi:nucleotide-binding universal stress UspA family protein|nr:universal stress protein [Trebonia sp.]